MPNWLITILCSAGSVVLTLTTTFLFNKLDGFPKELKKQKDAAALREQQLQQENQARDVKIAALEQTVGALPGYRAQSLQIQQQLQTSDKDILQMCSAIQQSVLENQKILNRRLDRLEKREKNALRAKILDEYRLFTDDSKNPLLAWSEMEHHAFFELVRDYEDLGGNDFVHSVVLPAVNELNVVSMSDKPALAELMRSRKL